MVAGRLGVWQEWTATLGLYNKRYLDFAQKLDKL